MIKHVLKDGRELEDIKGYTVKIEQAKSVYALIDRLNRKGSTGNVGSIGTKRVATA